MAFKGIQKTFSCIQHNNGPIEVVFPLLCPVREEEWLDGWDYKMIHSESGLIEKDCVFTTPHHGDHETVWQVTQYDPVNYLIEFVRVTPYENIVRINIELEKINDFETKAFINYKYTALNEKQNEVLEQDMMDLFEESMRKWERSINYYLDNGSMLKE